MKFTKFLFCVSMIVPFNYVLFEEDNAKRELGIKIVKARLDLWTTDESSIEDVKKLVLFELEHAIFDRVHDIAEKQLTINNEFKKPENKKALDCSIFLHKILLDKTEQDTSNKHFFDFVDEIESNNPECTEILKEFYAALDAKTSNK